VPSSINPRKNSKSALTRLRNNDIMLRRLLVRQIRSSGDSACRRSTDSLLAVSPIVVQRWRRGSYAIFNELNYVNHSSHARRAGDHIVTSSRGFAENAHKANSAAGDDEDDVGEAETTFVRRSKFEQNFYGIAHVQATFNNTIVNITNANGDTLCWSSGGARGTSSLTLPRQVPRSYQFLPRGPWPPWSIR
jgi:hypothetical protein